MTQFLYLRYNSYKNVLKFDKLQQTANIHAATSNFDRSYDMSVDVVYLRPYLRLAYAYRTYATFRE